MIMTKISEGRLVKAAMKLCAKVNMPVLEMERGRLGDMSLLCLNS